MYQSITGQKSVLKVKCAISDQSLNKLSHICVMCFYFRPFFLVTLFLTWWMLDYRPINYQLNQTWTRGILWFLCGHHIYLEPTFFDSSFTFCNKEGNVVAIDSLQGRGGVHILDKAFRLSGSKKGNGLQLWWLYANVLIINCRCFIFLVTVRRLHLLDIWY